MPLRKGTHVKRIHFAASAIWEITKNFNTIKKGKRETKTLFFVPLPDREANRPPNKGCNLGNYMFYHYGNHCIKTRQNIKQEELNKSQIEIG